MISIDMNQVKKRWPIIMEAARRAAPAASFAGGFAWDSLTMDRIDRVVDNLVLLAYLALLATFILLRAHAKGGGASSPFHMRFSRYYGNVVQFLLGGLFSGYVVYYFHSASLTKTSLFLMLIACLFVANEFIRGGIENLMLTCSLYFVAAFSFFIFFIPVATKTMSHLTFVTGSAMGLLAAAGLVYGLWRLGGFASRNQLIATSAAVCVLFTLLSVFYAANWIPPVPLSKKFAGIYHDVRRAGESYMLSFEAPPWYWPWKSSDNAFTLREGDSVYCFSAVFAPTELKKAIAHQWQLYDYRKKEWVVMDRIGFEITGGRGTGWRGYTRKANMQPGKWRVQIVTEEDKLIGEAYFDAVTPSDGVVAKLKTITY